MKQYVENEKPSWLYLDAERGEEMQYSLFNYFPDAHYRNAVDTALSETSHESGQATDAETAYFWYDPERNAVLQAEASPHYFDGLFHWQSDAISFLREHTDRHGITNVSNLDLYEATLDRLGSADEYLDRPATDSTPQIPTIQLDFKNYQYTQTQLDEFR